MFKPYSVIMPPFDPVSGGIRVCWGLYGWLLAKGMIVFPNATIETDFIGIYPEIYNGNPANATTVVRYLLNKPGVMSLYGEPSPTEFAPTDKLYYFSKIFAPDDVKDEQVMFLPICNLHVFKDQKKKRTKTCYIVGKGTNTNKHPKDSILIDRKFAIDQQALADLLNECHTLYSYDPVTAMFEIARLCGCKVVIIPNIKFNVNLNKYEPGMNGISYGIDNYVPLNVEEFREHYKGMIKTFEERLDNFIESTQHE